LDPKEALAGLLKIDPESEPSEARKNPHQKGPEPR
jgi:hypothetical protein